MFRFLRKYNKYILAVFGTLLLITFLVPYAITQIGQSNINRGFKWATIVGPDGEETLKSTVRSQAQNELRYLSNDQRPVGPFGIMDDAVKSYYPSYEVINDVSELPRAIMKQLMRNLVRRGHTDGRTAAALGAA